MYNSSFNLLYARQPVRGVMSSHGLILYDLLASYSYMIPDFDLVILHLLLYSIYSRDAFLPFVSNVVLSSLYTNTITD